MGLLTSAVTGDDDKLIAIKKSIQGLGYDIDIWPDNNNYSYEVRIIPRELSFAVAQEAAMDQGNLLEYLWDAIRSHEERIHAKLETKHVADTFKNQGGVVGGN